MRWTGQPAVADSGCADCPHLSGAACNVAARCGITESAPEFDKSSGETICTAKRPEGWRIRTCAMSLIKRSAGGPCPEHRLPTWYFESGESHLCRFPLNRLVHLPSAVGDSLGGARKAHTCRLKRPIRPVDKPRPRAHPSASMGMLAVEFLFFFRTEKTRPRP